MKFCPQIRVKHKGKTYYPSIYTVDILNKYITFPHMGKDIIVRDFGKSVYLYSGIDDSFGKPIYEGDTVICRALGTVETVKIKDILNIPVQVSTWPGLYEHPQALEVVK